MKTCMLGTGPPRDGIIRTSPGQECSKDKGALPGARRIFVHTVRSRSISGRISSVWFRPRLLILHLLEECVSLCPAKRQAPVAQWIEHLITVQKVGGSSPSGRAAAPLGAIHRRGFCILCQALLRECFFHARFCTNDGGIVSAPVGRKRWPYWHSCVGIGDATFALLATRQRRSWRHPPAAHAGSFKQNALVRGTLREIVPVPPTASAPAQQLATDRNPPVRPLGGDDR